MTKRLMIVLLGVVLPGIGLTHWYYPRLIANPTSTTSAPILGAPTTSTVWACVRADGTVNGAVQATQALVEPACGLLVAGDGITRYLEERVTTTRQQTTTTSTRRYEVIGSTQPRIADAQAATIIMLSGAGGGGAGAGGGGGGGLVGHGLTPTHYVAPHASVSGTQSSDMDVSNSPLWSACTVDTNPCTAGRARANADDNYVVEFAPGEYTAAGGPGSTDSAFGFGLAGSAGNLVTFVAKYPAAYNADSQYWSILQNTDNTGGVANSPTFGMHNYTKLVGFNFDYANGSLPSSRGQVLCGFDLTGVQIVANRFSRTFLDGLDDGDNYNNIQGHDCNSTIIRNNLFEGGYDAGGSHNEASITLYASTNVTIEHNFFDGVTACMYVKGRYDSGTDGNDGVIRYNKCTGAKFGIELTAGDDASVMTITQNIFTLAASGQTANHALAFENSAGSQNENLHVLRNTFVGPATDLDAGVIAVESGIAGTSNRFDENVVAHTVTTSQVTVNTQAALSALNAFTSWDYNCYYENGNTPQYHLAPTTYNGVAAWSSATSRDVNSVEDNPDFDAEYNIGGTSDCATASSTNGPVGADPTTYEIGLQSSPSF